MNTFDYETAWLELVRPMFNTLPQDLRELYGRVVLECGHLQQGKNLNMPWPPFEKTEGETQYTIALREAFDKVPAEILATAARVIYCYGHWRPSADVTGEQSTDKVGGGWKFANYADQSLAARINPILDPANESKLGISQRVHEGFIRVQCQTPDSWTWHEVGLATATTHDRIKSLPFRLAPIATTGRRTMRHEWDDYAAAFESWCEQLRPLVAPSGRIAQFLDLAAYMVDENEFKARQSAREAADPVRQAKARARLDAGYQSDLAKHTRARADIETEYKARVWLFERGFGGVLDNLIFYTHTQRFCFGWSKPIGDEFKSRLLDVLSEFPFDYDIEQRSAAERYNTGKAAKR